MVRDNFNGYKNNLLEKKSYYLLDLLKNYTNSKYISLCTNGTSSILLCLIALGLKEGDEVLVPSWSYNAVVVCCRVLKLKIILIDIDFNNLCMSLEKTKENISNKTKAILFINHGGYCSNDLIEFYNFCKNKNILFFEDSAQGMGVTIENGIHCGTLGDAGIISFSGTKLIRCGEGGCAFFKEEKHLNKFNELKNMDYGNFEISEILCSFLIPQLLDIEKILEKRKLIQDMYRMCGLNILSFQTDFGQQYNSVAYISPFAEKIHLGLKLHNIETRYKFYKSLHKYNENCLVGKQVFEEYIELPQSFDLTYSEIEFIVGLIKNIEKIGNNQGNSSKIFSILKKIKT